MILQPTEWKRLIDIYVLRQIQRMGNRCCAPELDKYEIKLQQKGAIIEEKGEYRKGLPSQKIAIRVSEINKYFTSESDLQEVNRMIFVVAEDERKKFKQTMRINKEPILSNKLKQPYFISSLGIFYIGEWVFNQFLNQNVPGGIGRLYEDGSISEGVFKTFLLDAQAIENEAGEQEHQNILQNSILFKSRIHQDQANRKNRYQQSKIQKLLRADRQKLVNDFKFEIKLDGQGRISSTQDNGKTQIVLEGQFLEGKLNGRGTLKMITNENQSEIDQVLMKKMNKKKKDQLKPESSGSQKDTLVSASRGQNFQEGRDSEQASRKTEYNYIGFWKEGNKHGKGVEKVQYFFKQNSNTIEKDMEENIYKNSRRTVFSQSFRYEGSFQENWKHGKGNLTFLGSIKHQHEVERDIEKMQKQMISEGQNIKAEARKSIILRKLQQEFIEQKLERLGQKSKQKIKKHHLQIKQSDRSLIFDETFNTERKYRFLFNQNYIGDFKDGNMDGQGIYTWANGKTYKGKWENNKMHGKGQFYWPDGTYYVGDYRDDQRNGQGILIWNVLKRYRGDWAFGMRHGYGETIQVVKQERVGDLRKIIIKGHIWNRDKSIKHLFEQIIEFDGQEFDYLKLEADRKYDEEVSNKENKKVYGEQVKFESMKFVAAKDMTQFSSTLSRFVPSN